MGGWADQGLSIGAWGWQADRDRILGNDMHGIGVGGKREARGGEHVLPRAGERETDDRKEKEIRNNVAGRTGIPEEEFMTCSDDANSE